MVSGEGEELLVDYGMEHCLRNQAPLGNDPGFDDNIGDVTNESWLCRCENGVQYTPPKKNIRRILMGKLT